MCWRADSARTSELRDLLVEETAFGLKSDHGKPYTSVTLTWRKTNQDNPTKGAPSTSGDGIDLDSERVPAV